MKTNYLNNKDLLTEIHNSKNSYCSFKNFADNRFDLIVNSRKEITKKAISEAKANRVTRLNKLKSTTDPFLTIKDIKNSDLVFRVMSWEHIPLALPKQPKKSAKSVNLSEEFDIDEDDDLSVIPKEAIALTGLVSPDSQTHVKVNFPPFIHVKFVNDEKNAELEIVGKSHWKGDLEKGEFCKTHGQISNTLALMYMKLCERYGTRGNWRGYTYNDEMRSQSLLQLVQVGLQFNEAKSENPFSYLSMVLTNVFTRVLNIEKRNQAIRDDLLEKAGYNPSMARQMKQNAMTPHD